jgi:phthiodiolone/phenolphthiodiolone dimycocerosates ketoreductase
MTRIQLGVPGGIMPPFNRVIQQAQGAEAAGYDSAWWPCHLMGWHPQSIWRPDITPLANHQKSADVYFDPIPAISAVAASTEKIKLGLGVTDVIRRHPTMLAQAALTIDHIARGRFILGLGSGEQCNLTPYGFDFSQPVSKLEEGLNVVRLLWESQGKPVNFSGKHFHLEGAVLGLEPYEGKSPPVWVAAHGPRMLALTGRSADGWLPTMMTPAEYRDKLQVIRRASREAGRDEASVTAGMLAYVVVDEDGSVIPELLDHLLVKGLCLLLPTEIFRRFGYEPPFGEGSSGFHNYVPSLFGYEDAMRVIRKVPREVVEYFTLHGTPEDVASQLTALAEAGLQQVVLWNITAFADPARAKSSFQCLDRIKALLSGAAVQVGG